MPNLLKKGDSLTIIGRRWFQKSYGNTYHSVVVLVNGEHVYYSGQHYGYDSAYVQTAHDWLKTHGYMEEGRPAWYLRDTLGVEVYESATDVSREKDL